MKKSVATSKTHRSEEEILNEIKGAMTTDDNIYTRMTPQEIGMLPMFVNGGEVAMYEVNGVLLGKNALVRYLETIRK